MPAEIALRRARPSDIDRIARIEQESFLDPWKAAVFAEALSYFPESFFVATVSGEVVGFVLGGLEDTGEEVYGHICNLAVTPAWRKRGIARRLVGRVEQQFGLPNSTAHAERVTRATEEIGWPLDLNHPMDRESVDKAISFHDP